MPVGWFICPMKRSSTPRGSRYTAMQDFNSVILADGGKWSETEVLGDRAIVKVRASDAILTTIAGTPTFRRIPLAALDNPLSSLTTNQRTAIRNELLDAGYTTAEVNARFPNLANNTLGDALRFLASRRLESRYDPVLDAVFVDGEVVACKFVDLVNTEVQ